jgi:integrase
MMVLILTGLDMSEALFLDWQVFDLKGDKE